VRILLVHNFYGSAAPSGENRVFELEKDLLLKHGHVVDTFTRHSDEIRSAGIFGVLRGALSTPYNPFTALSIKCKVEQFKPDIVHVHNTFPLISPSFFKAIGNKAARVLTLHNYRLLCPAAIPTRAGNVCTDCMDNSSVWPSLKYGCYRNSRAATLPLALNVALHRVLGTWQKEVDTFIALTAFQRDLMVSSGLPEKLTRVKPNYYPGNPTPLPWANRGDYMVFVGRLASEKGCESLIRAWSLWGEDAPELRIIGDGPLRIGLEKQATYLPIRFLGQLSSDAAHDQISHAKLLLLPSECFEGVPMVLLEAFAFGTPTAVSNIGPLPSIVQDGVNGVVFQPSDPRSIIQSVQSAQNEPGMLELLASGARQSFESLYSESANYKLLLNIYEHAIAVNRQRNNRQ